MACPTCDHTMHKIADNIVDKTWWCPRCGTLKDANDVAKPKLVILVAKFVELLEPDRANDELSLEVLKHLGVTESIALPGHRR